MQAIVIKPGSSGSPEFSGEGYSEWQGCNRNEKLNADLQKKLNPIVLQPGNRLSANLRTTIFELTIIKLLSGEIKVHGLNQFYLSLQIPKQKAFLYAT
ncbi:hypothetical protein [Pedobacter sp. Leaf194]|uniref:hypothetical protein n=1 Tax=Pedobacter sp. Leaf194 TaxID=1736297 RepID=UPI000702E136|nr:hypothetical protein [Pedobacter sp. Leaf194]KQS37114.1 hypothetical protein ASG14_08825 [Pedobacter sp. Leaf194]RYD78698.1 MAG: hypothetical protein EOP55_06510 [Sphingobacteriales bacterium]